MKNSIRRYWPYPVIPIITGFISEDLIGIPVGINIITSSIFAYIFFRCFDLENRILKDRWFWSFN